MSRLQAASRNRFYVTRIEIKNSLKDKMYTETADIFYLVKLLDKSHNSTYALMGCLIYLLAIDNKQKENG